MNKIIPLLCFVFFLSCTTDIQDENNITIEESVVKIENDTSIITENKLIDGAKEKNPVTVDEIPEIEDSIVEDVTIKDFGNGLILKKNKENQILYFNDEIIFRIIA
ncbi:MAG: hypothetical protein GY828_04995 [Candidatus Gracilibacteria bacterium]|nr:hypothetical protein [Candidatus Gracilibacteria bacterium]